MISPFRPPVAAALLLSLAACGAVPGGGAVPPQIAGLEVGEDGFCRARGLSSGDNPREIRFATLCPPGYTAELVASLQRALAARGAFGGRVSGVLDDATFAAVRDWQSARGLDSEVPAVETLRSFGLVPIELDLPETAEDDPG